MKTAIAIAAVAGLSTIASAQAISWSWSGPTSIDTAGTYRYILSSNNPNATGHNGNSSRYFVDGATVGEVNTTEGAADTAGDFLGRLPVMRTAQPLFPGVPQDNGGTGVVIDNNGALINATNPAWAFGGSTLTGTADPFFAVDITITDLTARTLTFRQVIEGSGTALGSFPPTFPGDNVAAAYTVDIVPAPASMALLGLGGLVAGRRRR